LEIGEELHLYRVVGGMLSSGLAALRGVENVLTAIYVDKLFEGQVELVEALSGIENDCLSGLSTALSGLLKKETNDCHFSRAIGTIICCGYTPAQQSEFDSFRFLSSEGVRSVCRGHLERMKTASSSSSNSSGNNNNNIESVHALTIGSTLLSGGRTIFDPDLSIQNTIDGRAVSTARSRPFEYENDKRLVCEVLGGYYENVNSEGSLSVVLEIAVEYRGWEVVMELCDEGGGEIIEMLRVVIGSVDDSSELIHFALQWLTERNRNADICDLSTHVSSVFSFSDSAQADIVRKFIKGRNEISWMKEVREGRFGEAQGDLKVLGGGEVESFKVSEGG